MAGGPASMSDCGLTDRAEVGYAHNLILPDRAYAGMPGSDDDPDKLQTYGTDNTGKSKTSQPAPKQVGRENARTDHKARDVDAKTVSATQQQLTEPDGDAIIHESVYVNEDSDTSAVFDEDTGALSTTFDAYFVRCVVEGQGGGSDGRVQIRVNNDSTSNYEWVYESAGSTGNRIGNTEWWSRQFDTVSIGWAWRIGHGNGVGSVTAREATITRVLGGQQNKQTVQWGDLSKDVGEVNRIRVFTDFNATGWITISGVRHG